MRGQRRREQYSDTTEQRSQKIGDCFGCRGVRPRTKTEGSGDGRRETQTPASWRHRAVRSLQLESVGRGRRDLWTGVYSAGTEGRSLGLVIGYVQMEVQREGGP